MFDIGFSELFLVAIVALLVLGPERLPKAARFAGLWVRRARAQWYSVKTELENELADEDLRRSLRATQDELRNAREQLRESGEAMRRDVESGIGLDEPGREPPAPPSPEPREPDPDGGHPGEPEQRDPASDEPDRREPGTPPPTRREPDEPPSSPDHRDHVRR